MRIIDEDFGKYIPDNPIFHSSGYTLNMPLGLQGPPGWEGDYPDVLQSIYKDRDSLGIVVKDDLFKPREDEEPMKSVFDGLD